MNPNDDYLFEPDGAMPDEDVVRLEEALKPLRWQPGPRAANRPRRRVWLIAAGVAAVALIGAWMWSPPAGQIEPRASWTVRVDGATAGELAVGDWLDTARAEWTHVDVPEIGEVAVARQSRLRLLRTGEHEHRLELRRGRVRAHISAPPRLFIVETPAAVAVDLGCVYELDVDERGNGRLRVDSGWVALERPDSIVRVPAGFSCAMRAERGLGVPVLDMTAQAFRDAVAAFETGAQDALGGVLAQATEDDAITLFHLIPRVPASRRGALVDKLAEHVPLPDGVTRDGVIALQANMLERWWDGGVEDMW